jgi:acyl-homoserine lactone acylase PvdQ
VLKLAELQAPVEILRDHWGVPHIYAANQHAGFLTQGFVHAKDRLWQMELNRQLATGHVSEMLGSPHYDDLADLWSRGEYHPMVSSRSQVEARAEFGLTLAP